VTGVIYSDTCRYVVGTEDGNIHKCSCSYNEQYLETYSFHSGPVYRVRWSPLCPSAFLSCSADWTIKLWDDERADKAAMSFSSVQVEIPLSVEANNPRRAQSMIYAGLLLILPYLQL
jgi:WD40 repeat protein